MLFTSSKISKHILKLNSQGSAKLEKAEILQMTVDHLKMLHAAGGKGVVILLIHTQTYHLVFVIQHTITLTI